MAYILHLMGAALLALLCARSRRGQKKLARLRQTGLPPPLTLAEGMRWHAFLSHTWATGQDQTHAVKHLMLEMMPQARLLHLTHLTSYI